MKTITYSHGNPRRVADFLTDHGITEATVGEAECIRVTNMLHAHLTTGPSAGPVPVFVVLDTEVAGFEGSDEAALAMAHLGGFREPESPQGGLGGLRGKLFGSKS